MSKEVMRQALEALEKSIDVPCYGGHPIQEAAAVALREALAEPDFWEGYVPEPTMYLESGGLGYGPAPERKLIIGYVNKSEQPVKPATEQSSAVQPAQQEPVGEVNRYGLDSHGRKWHGIYWYDPNVDVPHGTKLYTSSPAQRTWVGLTDEEISLIVAECSLMSPSDHYFAQAIEAKLRSKNEDRI